MANPPEGWKPSASGNQNVYETSLGTVQSNGSNANLILETNYTNGSYTVYQEGALGTRTAVYTQDAGSNTIVIKNQAAYDAIGSTQIDTVNATAKTSSYNLNQSVGTTEQKDAVNNSTYYKSLANTSSGPNEENQYSGYSATDVSSTGEYKIGIASNYKGGIVPGVLQYPYDMSDSQDKIKFTAVEIEKSGMTAPGGASQSALSSFSPPKNSFKQVDSSIFIGIQGPIQDQNTVSWGEGTLSAVEAFLFNTARKAMGGDTGKALEDAMQSMYTAAKGSQGEIGDWLAGQAASVPNILSRTKGKILNPNLELLFQGPQLRPFNFQFKFTARHEQEAEAVKYIIKYFKRHMAVRKDTTNLFLKAPHVFTIQYLQSGGSRHKSLNLISPEISGDKTKACALLGCSVDYSPLGTYMTFNDTAFTMVSYNITLQFQEIEPIYDTDYELDSATENLIGF